MRKILILAAAVLIGGGATATALRAQSTQTKPEATKVCTMKVTGMTCSGCEAAVKIAAKRVDGVKDVKVSYAKGTAEVTYDSAKTSPDAIAKAIAAKTGYRTEVAK